MMKNWRLVSAAAFLLPSLAWGWQEPDGFRGIPWGGPESLLQEKFGDVKCSTIVNPILGDRECRTVFSVGKIRVPSASLWFRSGGLVAVTMLFAMSDFRIMSEIFIERYGQPTSREPGKISWVGPRVLVMLTESGTRSGWSLGYITITGEIIRRKKEEDADHQGAAKDL